jgi:hypothetical protein
MLANLLKGSINRRHFKISTSAPAGEGVMSGSLPSKALAAGINDRVRHGSASSAIPT